MVPLRVLRPGDRVAVVACSSPFDAGDYARGLDWLRERVTLHEDPRCPARQGFLAGPDADRAAMLLEALGDPQVRAVLAVRGGYGAMRVLERAGASCLAALRRDPKPLVGFSDLTALHALWAQAGVRSVHAPMVAAIGHGAPEAPELWSVLQGAVPAPWAGLPAWCGGAAEGVARGGNLALVAALAGTPWQLDLAGAVLFLEDTGERPYRLDRMLTTLRLAGALRGLRGVVLGDFDHCEPGPDGTTVGDVLRERLGDLGVPVLAGAPFGHGDRNRPLVLGARVRLEAGTMTPLEGLA